MVKVRCRKCNCLLFKARPGSVVEIVCRKCSKQDTRHVQRPRIYQEMGPTLTG